MGGPEGGIQSRKTLTGCALRPYREVARFREEEKSKQKERIQEREIFSRGEEGNMENFLDRFKALKKAVCA